MAKITSLTAQEVERFITICLTRSEEHTEEFNRLNEMGLSDLSRIASATRNGIGEALGYLNEIMIEKRQRANKEPDEYQYDWVDNIYINRTTGQTISTDEYHALLKERLNL